MKYARSSAPMISTRRSSRPWWWALVAGVLMASVAVADSDVSPGSTGVVLMYHHVAADTPTSTSVRPERFREHIEHLEEHDFNIWPLARLVAAARAGEPVPERTVALTFDDAYASVYENAWPLLAERDWPFTVFVAPADVDRGSGPYADWDQLREMERGGATMANHSMNHPHMAAPAADESEQEWRERLRAEITDAQARLEEEFDAVPALFAWPYGEYSPAAQALLADLGFVGFGQHSGAVGPVSDFTALPRFPMAVGFDDLESFRLKVRTRPLPVTATEPASGVMDPRQRTPRLTIELGDGHFAAGQLACYSRGRSLEVEWLDEARTRFRVEGDEVAGPGRVRVNCTAPATDANQWYWYSFQWMMPREDGNWYEG